MRTTSRRSCVSATTRALSSSPNSWSATSASLSAKDLAISVSRTWSAREMVIAGFRCFCCRGPFLDLLVCEPAEGTARASGCIQFCD